MIYLLLLLLMVNEAEAHSSFYSSRARGWFWYEEKKPDIDETQGVNRNMTAAEQLKKFQKELEEKRAVMIMQPSVEAAKDYIAYQNEVFHKADQVSKYWKIAMLGDENLNIVKDLPISDVGAKLHAQDTANNEKELLKSFAKDFQLLFFYKKSCEYCTHFANVLESFSHNYDYKVAAITLDGGVIKKFPAITNDALVAKLNVQYTPALFVYSEKLKIATPVAHGYLSIDLLEKNMVFIAKQLRGQL